MLAQEPDLHLVRTKHLADQKVVAPVVAQFRCPPGKPSDVSDDDLVCIQ
jgi:hypothetical protein